MSKGVLKVTQKGTRIEEEKEGKNNEKLKSKIPITFNSKQLKLIEDYKGILGNTKAEIIRNIVINWLLEKKFGGDKNEERG